MKNKQIVFLNKQISILLRVLLELISIVWRLIQIILFWTIQNQISENNITVMIQAILQFYKMLRLFTKLIHPFARKIGSTRHRSSPVVEEEQQEAPIKKSVRSEYQQMKQKFTNIEQEQALSKIDDKGADKTMDFIEKMLLDTLTKEKAQIKSKVKPTLQQKMRKIGLPEEFIGTNLSKSLQNKSFKKEFLQVKDLKNEGVFEQILKQTVQLQEKDQEREIKLAQQQMMIEEILKNSKEKELKLQNNEKKETAPVLSDKQYEKKLLLRKEKIIQSLQNNQDPSNMKIQLNSEDLLAMKYSPQILAKAHQYKNNQLRYFKDLVVNDERLNRRKDDMLKRRYKDQQDEKKFIKKQDQRQLNKIQPQTPNLYKEIKGEQGLTLFEDEQFYKKKALKQMKQKQQLTRQDLKLKQELDRDLEIGDKVSNVFLDEVVYHKDTKLQKQIQYRQTSFGKQQKKLKQLNDKLINLGMEFDLKQIQQLSKQLLFEEKHFLEQQQGFQKYLQRKQKKKNMKKQLKAIHDKTLRDDIDFNKEEVPQMSIKQIKNSSEYSKLEDDYKKIQQHQQQKESLFVQQTPQEKKSQIHSKKTLKNMSNFVYLYFVSGLFNHNASQFDSMEILEIIPNRANTVINVFWNIQKDYLTRKGVFPQDPQYQQKYLQLKSQLQQSLKKQSGYISGKMTQLLRLRYGPDIRFFYDTKTSKTIQAIQQLRRYTKQIAMVELQEYSKKGLVNGERQSVEYYDKLLDVAKSQLHEFNNRKLLLSKKYQKDHKQDEKDHKIKVDPTSILQASKKKKRKNPILEEKQDNQQLQPQALKHKNRKKPSQKLWDTIDLL